MDILLDGEFEAAELHEWRQALRAALPEARWLDRDAARASADTVQVAVVANPAPGSLQGLPRLRLIQSLWAGVDRLLRDPTLPQGVPIARMVDPAMNAAMAETALWATLALHRGFFGYAQAQRQGLWQPGTQRRAGEVRVTMLGLGQMGLTAARRIAQQGYRVSGWSLRPRDPSTAPAAADGIACRAGADAGIAMHGGSGVSIAMHAGPGASIAMHAGRGVLGPLLAASDIVVNLLPLTPATQGLLDARFFAALPRGAGVVNLARGAHVVDADLLAALDGVQVGHAVLDVFNEEPLPAAHPYWRHPRVTLLPHVAAQTDPHSAAQVVAANVRALGAGAPLAHLVARDRGY